jgi:hypothetical protein
MTNKRGLMGASIMFVLAMLVACGGGSGSGRAAPTVGIVTGFTKTVRLPVEPSGTGDWSGLFQSSNIAGARYQSLARAQDIQGSGPLRSLALRFAAASTGNSCSNVTIKLVHRPMGPDLSTTFAYNVTLGRGAPVTVFGPATLTIPAGAAGEYFTVPLGGSFNYNGVDNLVVDIESDVCTADTILDAHDANPVYTALVWKLNRTAATGLSWNSLADMQFTFAGGDNRVQSPGGEGINAFPFAPVAAKVQLLYYPTEINGSGPVTGIAFPVSVTTTAQQTYTITIKFGHSTLAELIGTFADNFNSGAPVTMANAVSFEIPAGFPAGRYLWVPVPDGTFNYNGTDNLIVEIETTPAAALTWVRTHEDAALRRLVGSPGSLTGSSDAIVNDIQLRFAGGSMEVNTPTAMSGGAVDGFPFYATEGKRQFLYRAAELGTRGTISAIACRAAVDGSAETGFNYTLALSHSTAPTLGSNFATNLASPVTVFSGSFDLPAVVAGDWIEIPFTTPFAYNGKDNLVVQVSGMGGTADGFACASDSATPTLYAARRLFGANAASAAGSVGNTLIDMRFTLQ